MAEPLSFLIKSAFDATGITAATNSIKSIDGQINRVSRGFNQLMGLMGAGGIGAAIFSFGKSSVMEFAKSEAGVAKLTKALQNLGTFTAEDVRIQTDFAKQLQLTTKYSDEDIVTIQTQLVTYGLYGEKLKQATAATLDLAVKTGSTETASKLLGKAFQGQTDTLSRYGIKIDANITGAAKFDAVLGQVQARMGGMAEVEGKSFEGQLKIMANRFSELKEKIGKELMPVANAWLNWLGKATTATENLFSKESDELKGIDLTIYGLKEKIRLNNLEIQSIANLGLADSEHFKKMVDNQDKYAAALKRVMEQKRAQGLPVAGRPTLAAPSLEAEEEMKARKLATADAIRADKEYLKENQKMMTLETEILGYGLTQQGQMYTRYFGEIEMKRRADTALQGGSAKQMESNQEQMIERLKQDYDAGGKTISGGWKQAMDEMEQAGLNWQQGFTSVINSSIGPATEAFKTFVNMSKSGFLDMGKLAEGIFRGIRDAFFDMIMQMAAKAAVFGFLSILFPGSAIVGKGLSSFLGLVNGGPVPGQEGAPVPMLAHGGEFILSANVVKAIKASQPTAGLSSSAIMAGASGGNVLNITNNITAGAGTDIKAIFRAAADGTKKGVSEFMEFARVSYKQGVKRSGEAAL